MERIIKKYTVSLNTLGIGLFFLGTNNIAHSTALTVGNALIVILGLLLILSHFVLMLINGWKTGGIRTAITSVSVTYLLDI